MLRTALIAAIGVVLTVGGCGGLLHAIDTSNNLANHGVKVTATIDDAVNDNARPRTLGALNHGRLHVTYRVGDQLVSHVRVWLPERTHYRAGDRVEVAYDRKSPRHAVLTHGGDPGPLALVFFFVFVAGLCVFWVLWTQHREARE